MSEDADNFLRERGYVVKRVRESVSGGYVVVNFSVIRQATSSARLPTASFVPRFGNGNRAKRRFVVWPGVLADRAGGDAWNLASFGSRMY